MNLNIPSPITKLNSIFLKKKSVEIYVKRDDLIHEIISGNKSRKLKYNFMDAQTKDYTNILSYGGPYSNHLHALSYMSKKLNLKSIGVVRGQKYDKLNPTLSFCQINNMSFYYLNREDYRHKKYDPLNLQLFRKKYGEFYLIPEGGNNLLGLNGCSEILSEVDVNFDFFCCAVGTSCTASGIIRALKKNQFLIGFCPFLKILEQENNIKKWTKSDNWKLVPDLFFKGFGQIDQELTLFVKKFYWNYNIKLDLIYMGKLFYHLFNYIQRDFFKKNTKILVLHSGGLQGLHGFNFDFK
ncbi:MAG: 1-aminocyclopropane-1-carboxylate deaminase [Flavobacteriales bacterium]|nr:1-aminocyclopropane-1-carboxylate deaminase [Flavobacteriales bacterium]